MNRNRITGLVGLGVLVALLLAAPTAFAQGCAMCRATAEAAGAEARDALNLAILVLLVPTLLFFVAVLVFAFRHRQPAEPPPASATPESVCHLTVTLDSRLP